MKFGKVLAAAAVLGVAGMAQAASISVTNLGNPVGNEGADTSLTRWDFDATIGGGEGNINTLLMSVSATSDLIHQVWAFGGNVPSPNGTGNFLSATANTFDSHIPDGAEYSVIVTAPTENRPTVGGSTDTAVAADSGYGNSIVVEAAIPGAGVASSDILHLVLPSGLTQVVSGGDVVVEIELVQIGGQQTFATYHFAAAAPIPVPAAYPLGLAGLGILAAVRRRITG